MKKHIYPMKIAGVLAAGAIWVGASMSAMGTLVVTGSDADGRAASATFDISGSTLTMTLENTGMLSAQPVDVLTALFFTLDGGATIAPIAESLGGITTPGYSPNPLPADMTLGGAWAYKQSSGSSAVGFGVWGNGPDSLYWNTPNPPRIQGGEGVDGLDFGIIRGVAPGANTPITTGVFEMPSVTFMFAITGALSESQIQVSKFQYGTALDEPSIAVPEPTTMIAGALLLLPFGASTLRILRRNRKS